MSFQDELNQVTQTPEDIKSQKDKQSYTYGVNEAYRAHQEIKKALLECAKEGKYDDYNLKKRITYKYRDGYFLNDVLDLRIRDVFINKSFFNRGGEYAHEARFDMKDSIAFNAYMEKLEELCKNDEIFIELKVYYNSVRGQKIYNIDEKFVDYALLVSDVQLYIICIVEY